jgi:hypothetical protein
MAKVYRCKDCGQECPDPVYFRLQFTLCGLTQARLRLDRNTSIPVGHYCKACLLRRVRTVLGGGADLGRIESLLAL